MPPIITFVLLAAALVYTRGWLHLWRTLPNVIPPSRLAAFWGGTFVLWIAIASPLAHLDDDLLIAHMAQHLLLMTVAAPLILLGAPAVALLQGLPVGFVRSGLGPILRWRPLQWAGRQITHPLFCWLAGATVVIVWHIPALFELALRSEAWHVVEHSCFLLAGFLFWWPIVQPWPSIARWPEWSLPLYLFLATLPCDALSAFLTFCGRVVYPSYLSAHRPFGLPAIQDQQWAGSLMWVWVTFAYLAPAVYITIQILSPRLHKGADLLRPAQDSGKRDLP
jgi:cytochrome c oxidase assembly factor CtaG